VSTLTVIEYVLTSAAWFFAGIVVGTSVKEPVE
jgi:hypothetical protein